MEDAALKDK